MNPFRLLSVVSLALFLLSGHSVRAQCMDRAASVRTPATTTATRPTKNCTDPTGTKDCEYTVTSTPAATACDQTGMFDYCCVKDLEAATVVYHYCKKKNLGNNKFTYTCEKQTLSTGTPIEVWSTEDCGDGKAAWGCDSSGGAAANTGNPGGLVSTK